MSMKVGVSGLVYAKVLTDTVAGTTYGPITSIPGVASADNKTGSSVDTFFADNGPYETVTSLGNITIDLEVADPSQTVMADILGHTVVAGVVQYGLNDIPPDVAIGFIGLKASGAQRLVWLLKGKFKEADDTYKTKGSKTDAQSMKLSGEFTPLFSNLNWKKTVDSDDTAVLPAVLTAWFTLPTIEVTIA